jgi:putative hydrolase of the HAD superfamily
MPSQHSNGAPQIEAVILDYGQVLSRRPTQEEFTRMAQVFKLDYAAFHALWESTRGPYDRGDQTAEEYWLSLAMQINATLSPEQIALLRNLEVKMWCEPDPEMLAWLNRLHAAGMKTALLSNMTLDLMTHMQANCTWLNKFSFTTFSVAVGLIKPDPAIYQHALRGLGVLADNALFLDDRLPNVQAARAIGIHSIQFHSIHQLARELEQMGFPILPGSDPSGAETGSGVSADSQAIGWKL